MYKYVALLRHSVEANLQKGTGIDYLFFILGHFSLSRSSSQWLCRKMMGLRPRSSGFEKRRACERQ
jgi:hypothetical protein